MGQQERGKRAAFDNAREVKVPQDVSLGAVATASLLGPRVVAPTSLRG